MAETLTEPENIPAWMTTPCPACGAEPGEYCAEPDRSGDSHPMERPHAERESAHV